MKDRLADIDEFHIGPAVEDLDSKESKKSEKAVEKEVKRVAKARGWLCRKYKTPTNRGAPDCIFIKDGEYVFIEFKRPGKEPAPLQRKEAAAMLDHGAAVYWTESVRGGKEALGIL